MRPIRDISEIGNDSVLYHSAFGFAEVREVYDDGVSIAWRDGAAGLPADVGIETLRRVYALCPTDGFFHRAAKDSHGLQEIVQVDPVAALELLLRDLPGPQRRDEVRDWIVGQGMLSVGAFSRWWQRLGPLVARDHRFVLDEDTIALDESGPDFDLEDRFARPRLTAARRLDLALLHRESLTSEQFREQLFRAWATGGSRVRDLALAALRDAPPDDVLRGLLDAGFDSVDALIHAIRRGSWTAQAVKAATHQLLVARALTPEPEGAPVDDAGRLAAALARWGSEPALDAFAVAADTDHGRAVLRAMIAALPPRRAEEVLGELLSRAIGRGWDAFGTLWLGARMAQVSGSDSETLARAWEEHNADLAAWFRVAYLPLALEAPPPDDDIDEEIEGITTQDLDLEMMTSELPLEVMPRLAGRSVLDIGMRLAEALAEVHRRGEVARPSRRSIWVRGDGSVTLRPAEVGLVDAPTPFPLGEPASPEADVLAAAMSLIEAMIGAPWPIEVPPDRVLPYLRGVVPDLPISALAALDVALHPVPELRPRTGAAWFDVWARCGTAEEARRLAEDDPAARWDIGFDSHVGWSKLLTTQTNQDALYIGLEGANGLFVVCDGISTSSAGTGDQASGITAHVVGSLWEQRREQLATASKAEVFGFFHRAFRLANQAVCEAALRIAGGSLDGRVPMGTTAVAALVRGNRVFLAWLGDSRAYVVGGYGASLLTADQNLSLNQLRLYQTDALLRWDPSGHALTGFVGAFDDDMRPDPIAVSLRSFRLRPGERLVLCSDGITDYIAGTHPDVTHALRRAAFAGEPAQAARALVELANRAGGGDNASAIVATLRGG